MSLDHTPTELETLSELPLPAADELVERFPLTPNPAPASDAVHEEVMSNPGFGKAFTDHMAHMVWTLEEGWHGREVLPFANLSLSPAASVLHYGQEVFEGIKAYRHEDGSVWTFRPGYNAARINHSSWRLAMPAIDHEDFVASLAAYVRADERWVPSGEGASLYLRPFVVATEPFLGVRSAHRFDYYVIGSPSGPYFKGGPKGVSIEVVRGFHRAGPGGTGSAKCGGNYAASLLPQMEACERGFDQVCFLDTYEEKYLEELGGMNVFVVMSDGSVRTPQLSGTILQGGTRSAICRLMRDRGVDVREERIAVDDLVAGVESGAVAEVFACGTAAVVTPIARLAGQDFDVRLPVGDRTLEILHAVTDIQMGRAEDPYGWTYRIL
ncbi:branched-chain amino acid aminotransferase [Schaalia sp. 19OD2882]|uniref:branched-chain amino acid aminotransferase n=1 Tax=Schaalia sp. 19OD2882 TaxID=2794089 RepID=UPI001C1EDC8D|nr:branched-chain amino acid aminotransferase [Schaalia sp. 19OD2882]QWW19116.1 branched-chain amino acid aminotransferase [Schaalia sp. 19OD2882]